MSKIFVWCLVLIMAVFTSSAFALSLHPKTGDPLVVNCYRGTPTLDGVLSEWGGDVAVLDVAEQIADPALWEGTSDCSAKFYTMWDDTNIYVGVEVTDDAVVANQTGGSIWKNDCAEIFFATTNSVAGHDEHYQYGITPEGAIWNWCNMDGNGSQEPDYVQLATSKTGSGYVMECAVEYSNMASLDFSAGNIIGYHPCVDDWDGEGAEPSFQITWTGLGAHDQSTGFGHLVLKSDVITAVSVNGKLATTWAGIKR